MSYHCFSCGKELLLSDGKAGRSESCPACSADVHCCRNCDFYDARAYNECREPQADRVVDKNRSNFCDYFAMRTGKPQQTTDVKAKALADLDALFKK